MWPAFVAGIAVDAAIGHLLPPAGDSQKLGGAALVGCFFNLVAVVLASWPLGVLIRRRRPDMPRFVARDYGGTIAIVIVSLGLVLAGFAHHPTITAHRQARRDAIVRAQAFIGDRAPEPYRHNLEFVDVYAIEPGRMYRICVPSGHDGRFYCVVVDSGQPFPSSVKFAGYESNAVFAQGAQ